MENELRSRSEVPVDLTWDLSAIYPTEDAMNADAERMQQLAQSMVRDYRGKLNTPAQIACCADAMSQVLELMIKVSSYTDLAVSVDYYDVPHQERNARISRIISDIRSNLSFVDSEILMQDEAMIRAAAELTQKSRLYLLELIRQKPHQLHPEAERVLAAYSNTLDFPYEAYNTAKLADIQFPSFEVDGEKYPLGYSLFEDDYEYDTRTPVRHAAFTAFSEKIRQYQHVTAAAYNAQVQKEKITATLRGFDSVFDSLLFAQKVSRDMYNRQIDLIMEKLAPHMRRYAKLIQRLYRLDKMTYADLHLPLDAGYNPRVTIEGSREYVEKGLAIMGDDYVNMVREAYRNRWVDFAKNKGKSTGGFCASPYGCHSFILMTWNDRMSDVFTLAHELGHAGHFMYCNRTQSVFDTEPSSYFIEAPSTMNELLMGHYLLKTNDDKRFRRWVLSCIVSNTYYHNFVTHLLEAAYQREVYRIVDAGGSLQADTLSGIMRDVLTRFWGDTVELPEGAELTWMRQPHYYMGLYSYTYSAGLTVATQVCKRIEKEGMPAIEDWKRVLAAGGTMPPVQLAAMAGIDITTDAPLLDTIETIGSYIDEMIALTDEME